MIKKRIKNIKKTSVYLTPPSLNARTKYKIYIKLNKKIFQNIFFRKMNDEIANQ